MPEKLVSRSAAFKTRAFPLSRLALVVLVSALLGCKSNAEKVYDKCMDQMEKAAKESVQAEKAQSEAEKAFAQTAGTMMQAMGGSVCQSLKEQCEKEPEGAVCKAALSQYQ